MQWRGRRAAGASAANEGRRRDRVALGVVLALVVVHLVEHLLIRRHGVIGVAQLDGRGLGV